MLNPMKLSAAFSFLILMAATCFAQAEGAKPEEAKYFHLDFVIKELEGSKVTNSRTYTMTISTERNSNGSIRAGNRVPVGNPGQTQYMDVGVNIDCRAAKEISNQLAVYVTADVTNFATEASTPPLIRQNKWSGNAIVPLRKATVIFSSDDPSSKRQLQLELTASPIRL